MEKAILIAASNSFTEFQWNEFKELVTTAGAEEVVRVVQDRSKPDPAYFIGYGKAQLLAELVRDTGAGLVIAIQELSPVQIRNLENLTSVRVIDRTALILDIFAQRALTKEGKIQVELAQLNYLLPRISGVSGYSRTGGGIGNRGPGETKLELDRRRIRDKIADLRRELAEIEKNRSIQRKQREKNEIPTIALIGYTNSGKSTLFNRLTEAAVPANNRLFDTLDPIVRKITLDNKSYIILDTVGFVSDLPHQLVAAFKSTLEETVRSSLLLHVMDCSNPNLEEQFQAVQQVIKELKIENTPIINVLNKVDRLESEHLLSRLVKEWSAVAISAQSGFGIEVLIDLMMEELTPKVKTCQLLIPYRDAGLLDLLHQKSRILFKEYAADGIRITAEIEPQIYSKCEPFIQV